MNYETASWRLLNEGWYYCFYLINCFVSPHSAARVCGALLNFGTLCTSLAFRYHTNHRALRYNVMHSRNYFSARLVWQGNFFALFLLRRTSLLRLAAARFKYQVARNQCPKSSARNAVERRKCECRPNIASAVEKRGKQTAQMFKWPFCARLLRFDP